MQDILKLKVCFDLVVTGPITNLWYFKAAAINTVSGVNMTTRRQMLKIKVGTYLRSGHGGNDSHNSVLHQGMSEAKVEKIKV
jgi:hypothetical protein